MLPQNHNIDMIPQGVPIVVNVSQYDVGREINFYLYNGSEAYTPATGSTIRIEGTKPDNTGFSYSASYVGNKVTVQLTDQMTVLEGEVKCELRVTEGGSDVGSLNFILMVEKAALPSDIPISETEIPAIILLARAEQYNAEAWAVGTKNGQDVPSTDPAYHNNAKYYAEHMTASLESLSDTDITTPADKEVLKYNSNTNKWENSSENAESLSGLSDTSISSASNGQVLTYDNNSSKWKNANLPTTAMNDITDVSISSASDGQVLSYDALSSKWKNSAAPASDLSGLTDVTISSATNGQALLYDSTNSKWVNGDVAGSAADITYDNTTSGLTADDVQEAIDEVDGNLDTLSSKAYKTDDGTITGIASDDLLPIYDTSATAAKKITVADVVGGTVSNPNLIDNPWFTVNQRGESQYTAIGYGPDRWELHDKDPFTVDITNSGITLTHADNSNISYVDQFFEPRVRTIFQNASLTGKKVTLSVMLADGTVYSNTGVIPTFISTNQTICTVNLPNGFACSFFGRLSLMAVAIFSSTANSTLSIRAIKVEMGDVSTLAMDNEPNYTEELLKCQRYFVRYKQTNANAMEYGFMVASTATSAHGIVNLPTSMRTTPSLVVADATKLSLYGQYKYSLTALSIAICDDQNKVVKLLATTSGMTAGTAYMLQADTGYGFDLSADL